MTVLRVGVAALVLGSGVLTAHYWLGTPVWGQTDEIKVARNSMNDFLTFTANHSQYYYSYFKRRQKEGFLELDDNFVDEFAKSSGSTKKMIGVMINLKVLVFTDVNKSKILSTALDDALKGRGLEFKGEPVTSSDYPKNTSDLARIFEYRYGIILLIIETNSGKTLGRKELFNLQNHMHSLLQIATAFQVAS